MALNNLCSALIVYGSFAPGGKNHAVFSRLPGTWQKGKFVASLISPPDGVGPGESDVIEAWMIKFNDCRAEMFTPEWEAQKGLLHDRWLALDVAMGEKWGRTQQRWWPDDCEPVAPHKMLNVVNIYLPIQHFPHLEVQDDVPSPDGKDDFPMLWQQVKRGKKRYDWSLFLGLIKDSRPGDFTSLFGDLRGGDEFIDRLNRLYADHMLSEGSILSKGECAFFLYAVPLVRNGLPPQELVGLARADIAQRVDLLRQAQHTAEADTLSNLRFQLQPPAKTSSGSEAALDALELVDDIVSDAKLCRDHWVDCLSEACYGIAASFELQSWLMMPWSGAKIDFEPAYALWKAGGAYRVVGDVCYVYEVERRA